MKWFPLENVTKLGRWYKIDFFILLGLGKNYALCIMRRKAK